GRDLPPLCGTLSASNRRTRGLARFFVDPKWQRSTQDCHWRLRRLSEQLSRLSKVGSFVDVRLQSAPCGVPTHKGRRQTRNDAVQQLDHARFGRRGSTKRCSVPASRHGGCVREGDRVRAWVWPFLKLDASKENWRQGSPLPAVERGQAERASRCTRIP